MKKVQSTNPGKGFKVIGEIDQTNLNGVSSAVHSAKEAFDSWSNLPVTKRVSYYRKVINVYKRRSDEVARMQTQEVGKPISQSREDIKGDIGWLKHNLLIAPKYLKSEIVDESREQINTVFFEPYGVVAAIGPWNCPSSIFFISTTQALLAGNTVVFKHSEECPLTAKLLDEIFKEADFPEGVLNFIYGDGKVGQMLVNQDIDMIHFTGSSRVGQSLYKTAARKFIPVTLEMGGSSPGIIFNDANLDRVVNSVCLERYTNCGQICCALKRLIVQKDVYDEVVQRIINQVKDMKVGDPMKKDTFIGPLVAKRQLLLLEKQVKDAISKGAVVECGGSRPKDLDGAYYQPTVLTNIKKGMKVYREEVFGPVLPIIQFDTEEEAIRLANDTIYGLSAFVYTNDIDKADRVTAKLEAGNISINGASYFSDNSPFGGYKKSGMGSNDGKFGFRQVTRMKAVGRPR
ncbi:MAG: aldehyde dehydrogenase family protein [Candidatus Portnoybacteria bacterium]|nr:aldehyde dehydrogenase family protein [Candidatus Portnoybacteria bacterium]